MSVVVLLVGPSGCGKSTITNRLCSKYPNEIRKVKSYTTRQPRSAHETDYHFCTKDEFKQLPVQIAPTQYNGEFYCTTPEELDAGQIYIVNLDGINAVQQLYKGNKKVIVVGITASESTRYNRMILRGDSEVSAYKRIKNDHDAFKPRNMSALCDVIMPNNTIHAIDNIVEKLHQIICSNTEQMDTQTDAYHADTKNAALVESNIIVPVSAMVEWAQTILSLIESCDFPDDVRENLYTIADDIENACKPISIIEPILPGFKNGVLRNGHTCLSCAGGIALSDLPNDNGPCVNCPHYAKCTPNLAKYVLSNGTFYNGVNTDSRACDNIIRDYLGA